jgi:hypothetical protein
MCVFFLTILYSVANKTAYEVLDPLLEQHIKELNDKIKLRESSLASFCKTTADPKDQPSPASIVTAINNRCETDKVEFNTLRSELLTRELQEVSSIKSCPFN